MRPTRRGRRGRKERLRQRAEWLSDYHSICEALRAGRRRFAGLLCASQSPPQRMKELRQLAEAHGLSPQVLSRDEWRRFLQRERLARGGAKDSGMWVAAQVSPYPYLQPEEWESARQHNAIILACDRIQDVQNLGAIFRSYYALGGRLVLLSVREGAPVTPAVCRVSAGAVEHLQILRAEDWMGELRSLQTRGFQIGITDPNSSRRLQDFPSSRMVLVLGNEERGVRPALCHLANFDFRIPMADHFDSLNVAVCAGIIFYELQRQGKFGLTP